MEQKSHITNELETAGPRAKYDAYAKRIFSDKYILAHILNATIPEFIGHPIDEIIECIESTPHVSSIPLYPGKTSQAIAGISTESKIPNEGEVFFDILFEAYTPDQNREKVIIDVEIQNKFHTGYDMTVRGDFYCARILSSELGREFDIPDYQNVVRIYSIWICTDCPRDIQNTITAFPRTTQKIFGNWNRQTQINTMTPIIVCLGKGKTLGKGAPLHHLLETIISKNLTVQQKLDILESEYGIKQSYDRKELLNSMCNLSEGIFQDGVKTGVTNANIETARNLRKNGVSMNVIKKSIPSLTPAELEAIEHEQPEN